MKVSNRATTVDLAETPGSSEHYSAPTLDLLMLLKSLQSNIALVAEQYGLTFTQLYTMRAIAEEHRTMGKMAEAIGCDASNVTGIIDKLVSMGLVIRQEDPNDRRIKTVQLTSEGNVLLRQIMNAMPAHFGYPRVTQQEISELRRILLKLTGSVSKCDHHK